jgi:sigma-B regulation protein RsbU (phosphoserine phosphatase)
MGLASFWVFAVGHTLLVDFKQKLNEDMLEISAEQVSRMASDVSAGALNLIPQVEESLDNPARLEMLLERILKQNPGMRSCGISFVENYYPQKGRSYVPYVYRRDSTHIEVVNHAMQKQNYQKDEWFAQGLQAEEGFWSEPFFEANDTTKAPLVAYLHPIRNKQGRAVAVLGADLSIDSLYMKMDAMDEEVFISGWSGNGDKDRRKERKTRKARWVPYSFLISQNGTFIVHPKKHRIVLDNIENMAKASKDTAAIASVGRRMMAGEKGSYGKEIDMDMAAEVDVEGLNSYVFFTPVKGTGWSMGLVVPYLVIDIMAFIVAGLLVFFILLAVLIVWLVSWYGIRRATKPLKQLTTSANEVAKGNFDTVLPEVKHNDEIRLLRDSFEDMQHSLTKYMEDLKVTTASKAAIENELTIAHNIQMAMLPKIFPPYPNRNDIDIYGMLTPAKAVGGDLFDFYLHDNRLYFCIGDVSGKGVPASLVMAVTRSLFRNVSAHATEPHHIVRALNEAMSEGNESSMFVTLFVGVLELDKGLLHYCNAGHDAPLLISADGGRELTCDSNIPVGVMPGWEFSLQETTLQPHTTIFLYTDGLNEAENGSHEQFQMEGIAQVVKSLQTEEAVSSQMLIIQMAQAVARFVGEAEQSDDLTMLAIGYRPGK